jgi:hypothetical protein
MLILDNLVLARDEQGIKKFLEKAKNTKEGFYTFMTFLDLLKMYKTGALSDDEFNRSGRFDKKRARDIAENFTHFGFGQVTCGFNDGKLELIDAHHRLGALVVMNDELFNFNEIAQEVVAVRVIPSAYKLSTYKTLNSGKSHTGYEKINHPKMAVGSYSNEIINKAQDKAGPDSKFNKQLTQNLMDLTLAYETHGDSFDLDQLFAKRGVVTKHLNLSADRRSFSIDDSAVKKSADLTTKYLSLICYAESLDVKTEIVRLIKSPGFFLSFGLDYMTNGKILTGFSSQSNIKIVNKVNSNKFAKIKENTERVARRSRKKINLPALIDSLS